MPAPNVVCISIDGLRASALGAYGGAWGETPALDRLAAESLVLDNAWTTSPELDQVFRAWWHGTAPLAPAPDDDCPTLPDMLGELGLATLLVTDDLSVAQHPLASDFDERIFVDTPDADFPARDVAETGFAQFCEQALGGLQNLVEDGRPAFAWLHARGMLAAWDAPLEFRNALAEEEDPDPPDGVDVPCEILASDYDPDVLLGITQSYAGQVVVLDRCLAALFEGLAALGLDENTLIVLTAPRAFPLGEHLRVGLVDEALYGERLHVPCFVRLPGGQTRLTRRADLALPADLPATILAWYAQATDTAPPVALAGGGRSLLAFDDDSPSPTPGWRDHVVCASSDSQLAIRTPAWFMRVPADQSPELYVKPDDRWEANEVSDRLPAVVKGLQAALARYVAAVGENRLAELPPLEPELVR